MNTDPQQHNAGDEKRGKYSVTVKQIDVYGIEDRLRKSKTKEDKEVWHYIKKLKEALQRQQELTAHAISKLRSEANHLQGKEQRDEAVGFAEWINENYTPSAEIGSWVEQDLKKRDGFKTTEQLYTIYKTGKL